MSSLRNALQDGRTPRDLVVIAIRRFRNYILTPHIGLGFLLLGLLAFLVLRPLIEIALGTILVQSADLNRIPDARHGGFTLFFWTRALFDDLSSRVFLRPLTNTLLVSVGYTSMAMLLGCTFAYLMFRTDLPGKRVLGILVFIPYILPAWSIALGWSAIFRHSEMWVGLPGVLQHFTGIRMPEWFVFGPVPIMICLAVNYFAYAYLLIGAALSTVDGSLEESAEVNGAGKLQVMRDVTFPLVTPAILSACALTFAQGLGSFGVPQYLGPQADFYVLSTYLYRNISSNRMGDAFVLALVMVALAAIVIYLNYRAVGKRKSFTTMSGKGAKNRIHSLGRWRIPVFCVVAAFLFLTAVVPVLILGLESVMMRGGRYSLENFTLSYWIGRGVTGQWPGVLMGGRPLQATINSLRLGISVGAVAVVAAIVLGFVIVKGRGTRLSRWIEQLSFLPYVIPGAVLGAVYITMFSRPNLFIPSLYGTMVLLILAVAVARLPYASRTGISAMFQVGNELDESARMHGASWMRRVLTIMVPLTKQGLFAAFVLAFVEAIKDLSIPIMLSSPRTEVLTVMSNSMVEYGDYQYGYAIALLVVVIVLAGTLIARVISNTTPATGTQTSK